MVLLVVRLSQWLVCLSWFWAFAMRDSHDKPWVLKVAIVLTCTGMSLFLVAAVLSVLLSRRRVVWSLMALAGLGAVAATVAGVIPLESSLIGLAGIAVSLIATSMPLTQSGRFRNAIQQMKRENKQLEAPNREQQS
jgi:hypothetical protein